MDKYTWRRIVLLGIMFVSMGGVWFDVVAYTQINTYLEVHFLDVGQGDATLIETPDGINVLIDGGKDASVLRALAEALGFFDRHIDVVVATHSDSDHIGGLIDVLERYDIDTIVLTENESDTPTADAFMTAVDVEGADLVYARAGASLTLGASTTLEFLFPDRNPAGFETNAASIIAQLRYGEVEFMLTGDAPKSIEEYLVRQYGDALESEVLKVGHHGSDTSTADTFVSAVDPDYAVVSAGKDNRYGHPHREVVARLTGASIELFSTAEHSTVSFESDGAEVWRIE